MWNRFLGLLFGTPDCTNVEAVRQMPTVPATPSQATSLPTTLTAEQKPSSLARPLIFEPALKHYSHAMRAGEPQFESSTHAQQYHAERLQVMQHVLSQIADSPWAKHLILRGSALMKTWFGDQARPPGDLDWVVTPIAWKLNSSHADNLINGVIKLVRGSSVGSGLQIADQAPAVEEIWTYEKAPGKRMIVVWENDKHEPCGTLQIDIVFAEPLPMPAVETVIRLGHQAPVTLMTASKELSLVWKLVWLLTDTYPMGKDLYDAALLSETARLTPENVRLAFSLHSTQWYDPIVEFHPETIRQLSLDWDAFTKEHPWITESSDMLKECLIRNFDCLWTTIRMP